MLQQALTRESRPVGLSLHLPRPAPSWGHRAAEQLFKDNGELHPLPDKPVGRDWIYLPCAKTKNNWEIDVNNHGLQVSGHKAVKRQGIGELRDSPTPPRRNADQSRKRMTLAAGLSGAGGAGRRWTGGNGSTPTDRGALSFLKDSQCQHVKKPLRLEKGHRQDRGHHPITHTGPGQSGTR